MKCPWCGAEMRHGHVQSPVSSGLVFLPEGQNHGWLPTKKNVEKRGGVMIDGPYFSRYQEPDVSADLCETCHKVVLTYY